MGGLGSLDGGAVTPAVDAANALFDPTVQTLALPSELAPGAELVLPLWIRCSNPGQLTSAMLFHYQAEVGPGLSVANRTESYRLMLAGLVAMGVTCTADVGQAVFHARASPRGSADSGAVAAAALVHHAFSPVRVGDAAGHRGTCLRPYAGPV